MPKQARSRYVGWHRQKPSGRDPVQTCTPDQVLQVEHVEIAEYIGDQAVQRLGAEPRASSAKVIGMK